MTTYRLFCDGELIGTSALEERDPAMGTARGRFMPAPGYERVRNVFRLFASAQRDAAPADEAMVAEYYRLRDQLALRLETEAGVLIPTTWVHIVDLREDVDDETACEIEIHSQARSIFTDEQG